jgi:hypothetical protein
MIKVGTCSKCNVICDVASYNVSKEMIKVTSVLNTGVARSGVAYRQDQRVKDRGGSRACEIQHDGGCSAVDLARAPAGGTARRRRRRIERDAARAGPVVDRATHTTSQPNARAVRGRVCMRRP